MSLLLAPLPLLDILVYSLGVLAFFASRLVAHPLLKRWHTLSIAHVATSSYFVVVVGICEHSSVHSLLLAKTVDDVLSELITRVIYCVVREVLRQESWTNGGVPQLLDHPALVRLHRCRLVIIQLRSLVRIDVQGIGSC